jgi:hypothetical protein
MSPTHDMIIDNSTGANVRADLNNALAALVSNSSSSSEPSTKYAYMWWADTTTGILKIRNSANNAWVELLQLDGTLTLEDGSASTPALAFRDDLNTGIFSSAADTFNVATGGVERMELGAATIFNEDGADVDFRIEGDTVANLFYLDAGNNRIGILTASPQHDLDILNTGSGSNSSLRVASTGSSGDNDATIIINNGGSGDASLRFDYESSASRCKIYTSSSTNDLIFDTDGNETMRLKADHKVGIGTTSPSHQLHVVSSGTDTAFFKGRIVRIDGAAASNSPRLNLSLDGTDKAQILLNRTDSSLAIDTLTSAPITFDTNNTERLRIDSDGRMLIGATSSSSPAKLAVNGGISNESASFELNRTNDPADGENIGHIEFCQGNSSSRLGARIMTRRDGGVWGASSHPTRFEFHTCANGSNSPAERLRIDSSGHIRFGATAAIQNEKFTFFRPESDQNTLAYFHSGASSDITGVIFRHGRALSGFNGKQIGFLRSDGTEVGSIVSGASSTGFNTSSDYRLKENVTAISDGITRLKTLKPSRFNFKNDTTKPIVDGFLAHEVTAVPEAITGTKDQVDANNNPVYQQIDQSKLVPLLVAAVQELIGKVETLEAA